MYNQVSTFLVYYTSHSGNKHITQETHMSLGKYTCLMLALIRVQRIAYKHHFTRARRNAFSQCKPSSGRLKLVIIFWEDFISEWSVKPSQFFPQMTEIISYTLTSNNLAMKNLTQNFMSTLVNLSSLSGWSSVI